MENPRWVHNELTVDGQVVGAVIQSGGPTTITGNITAHAAADPMTRLADHVDRVREVLRAHAEKVPRRAMTDLGLSQIATQARSKKGDSAGVVAELWRDLQPELSALATSVGELAALKPHLKAITDSVDAL
ncbi:hypothetical protein [Actinokineospora sp. UTMC 2448]|uniref:hypothetical protein n=1 Tax=Actinokineospora sp. UTMC 2448 TaxID=2268449 RepID=UPI002164490A|nr:hypothetical protein [Actinokineospora sp. UTMC 2448]UVS80292.1 hypothetical protein Actkin_04042 [Actinokineospora sp. UTMC 2448]